MTSLIDLLGALDNMKGVWEGKLEVAFLLSQYITHLWGNLSYYTFWNKISY